MSNNVPITVAHGDGIGPEIMAATLHILKEAGARLDIETIEIGEKVYLARKHGGHRAERLGLAAPHQSLPQSSDHDAAGRRLQEPERHRAQDARPLRQRASVRFLSSVRRDQASGDGRGHRPRERRRPLRRHRAPPDRTGDAVPETDLASRLAKRSCATLSNTRAATIARRSPASRKTTS